MKFTFTATLILSTLFATTTVHAETLNQAVGNHVARVKDFKAREAWLDKWMRDRMRGAALTSELRRKAEQEYEKYRAQFALTRKKEDPLADEKRERIYLVEIEKREKEKEKQRAAFAAERMRIERAIAALPQIDPMKEYDLTTTYERNKKSN